MKLVLLWWEGLARRSAGLWVVVKASVHTFPAVWVAPYGSSMVCAPNGLSVTCDRHREH